MNDVLKRRIERYSKTLDIQNSSIRRLGNLENLIVGEVRGVNDTEPFAFFIKDGVISISDLKAEKRSVIEFTFHMTTQLYKGKGIRNRYKDCERLVAYVLSMVSKLDDDHTIKRVH